MNITQAIEKAEPQTYGEIAEHIDDLDERLALGQLQEVDIEGRMFPIVVKA